jgi:hypothetical protein
MTAEPLTLMAPAAHIRLVKLGWSSGRFTDLTASPLKLRRDSSHYAQDSLDMVSLTLMLGPNARHQFGGGAKLTVVQPGQI